MISYYKSGLFSTSANLRSLAQSLVKTEKHQLYSELKGCLDMVDPIDGKPLDEVVCFLFFSYYL